MRERLSQQSESKPKTYNSPKNYETPKIFLFKKCIPRPINACKPIQTWIRGIFRRSFTKLKFCRIRFLDKPPFPPTFPIFPAPLVV